MTDHAASLVDGLPLRQRLALAYARDAERKALLGFFALDGRLAGIVRHSREPALAQLRLAWWREQLAGDTARWPAGDALFAVLGAWQGRRGVLAGLVDAWEELTGPAPLPGASFSALADARAAGFAALVPGMAEPVVRLGRNWALADMVPRLSHPQERAEVLQLARVQDWRRTRLPRAMRPLAVLHTLAWRDLHLGENHERVGPISLLAAMRAGLIGI